ncbi:type II secretion system protein [Pseudomonas neustonica]|mgnify:CR=1 FL=1|uniref:Type II secretion system protein n=1 Tax=Pseudomonas neustonica TaxID=2487346 RepID=A0ABX9XLL4_9PSED|nr:MULTISPECIES: prepilin-type N-terminal cleavage/methylation domain-containing protein [Pseudomonas]ROZ84513.1 type II secretion system protein [Pseudomonas sp. SSM44]ROZ86316.1 type II secretion system protein [Pseudomonas neustonica]
MTTHNRFRQRGFTLLEMSVALIIVALIISALTLGSNLQRNTVYQHMATSFVRGWQMAFLNHVDRVGVAPGDSQITPTGKVNGADDSELCGLDLRNAMYAAGVAMPPGRSEGFETHYGYLDSNGNPQDVSACFVNVSWSVPGSSAGLYVVQRKNVLVLRGLTPDLARMIDRLVDGNADARFGSFREASEADKTSTSSSEWSLDNRVGYGQTSVRNLDESQVVTLTAYYLMDP